MNWMNYNLPLLYPTKLVVFTLLVNIYLFRREKQVHIQSISEHNYKAKLKGSGNKCRHFYNSISFIVLTMYTSNACTNK